MNAKRISIIASEFDKEDGIFVECLVHWPCLQIIVILIKFPLIMFVLMKNTRQSACDIVLQLKLRALQLNWISEMAIAGSTGVKRKRRVCHRSFSTKSQDTAECDIFGDEVKYQATHVPI